MAPSLRAYTRRGHSNPYLRRPEAEKPKNAPVALGQHDLSQERTEPVADAPDFTPEQWKWLKEHTLEFHRDYRPTRTLIEGL